MTSGDPQLPGPPQTPCWGPSVFLLVPGSNLGILSCRVDSPVRTAEASGAGWEPRPMPACARAAWTPVSPINTLESHLGTVSCAGHGPGILSGGDRHCSRMFSPVRPLARSEGRFLDLEPSRTMASCRQAPSRGLRHHTHSPATTTATGDVLCGWWAGGRCWLPRSPGDTGFLCGPRAPGREACTCPWGPRCGRPWSHWTGRAAFWKLWLDCLLPRGSLGCAMTLWDASTWRGSSVAAWPSGDCPFLPALKDSTRE